MELKDKTIVFLGSSVTYGSAAGGYSMSDYVEEQSGCRSVKWAVSGTTLVDTGADSYIQRMENEMKEQELCDHFICQLSTNDAGRGLPLGEISESRDKNELDTSTIIGAIEYIIAAAKDKWNCPVSFYTGTRFDKPLYQQMVDALLEIQKKWGIGIIDLWNDPEMNAVSEEDYKTYMNDPVHPRKIGYTDWWGPKFLEYLKNC